MAPGAVLLIDSLSAYERRRFGGDFIERDLELCSEPIDQPRDTGIEGIGVGGRGDQRLESLNRRSGVRARVGGQTSRSLTCLGEEQPSLLDFGRGNYASFLDPKSILLRGKPDRVRQSPGAHGILCLNSTAKG